MRSAEERVRYCCAILHTDHCLHSRFSPGHAGHTRVSLPTGGKDFREHGGGSLYQESGRLECWLRLGKVVGVRFRTGNPRGLALGHRPGTMAVALCERRYQVQVVNCYILGCGRNRQCLVSGEGSGTEDAERYP